MIFAVASPIRPRIPHLYDYICMSFRLKLSIERKNVHCFKQVGHDRRYSVDIPSSTPTIFPLAGLPNPPAHETNASRLISCLCHCDWMYLATLNRSRLCEKDLPLDRCSCGWIYRRIKLSVIHSSDTRSRMLVPMLYDVKNICTAPI